MIALKESGVLLDAEFDDLDFKSITGAKTGKPDLNLLFPVNANPLLLEAPTFTAFLSCICDCINWAPKRTQKNQKSEYYMLVSHSETLSDTFVG